MKMKKVNLYDQRFGKNEHRVLDLVLNDEGNLVFEGFDIGDLVKKHWGDIDYEFWLTIHAENLPIVLVHLIKECYDRKMFETESDFKMWLTEKGIPSEFQSWV